MPLSYEPSSSVFSHLTTFYDERVRERERDTTAKYIELSLQESTISRPADFPRSSLNSNKSPQKSSFSCKVYTYCLSFPLCNTASAVCKSGIRINSFSAAKFDSLVQHNALYVLVGTIFR